MNIASVWIGVIISAASLVVAIIALIKSSYAHREANAAQHRIVAIEEQRERERQIEAQQASLRLVLVRRGYDTFLIVQNHGHAEARNIQVYLEGKPVSLPRISGRNGSSILGAGSQFQVSLLLSEGQLPPSYGEIIWEDDSGNNRSYRTALG